MFEGLTVKVVIPALNESDSIGLVLADIPKWVDEAIVVANGSTDATVEVARGAGATVIQEPREGYGQACLAAMAAIDWCDIVVFLDGDYSDFSEQMDRLVRPIAQDQADMVLGRRIAVQADKQTFTAPQRFGTALACHLMRIFWHGRYRDMGPFRAIRWSSLRSLDMHDTTYGWTVEMQIKALLAGLRVTEVPVDYRHRIGVSKVSGTLRGIWGAATKILVTVGKYLFCPPSLSSSRSERLIVFGRWPTPGKTKTRLIPSLGALSAAELQRRMTVRTVEIVRRWAARGQREVEIRYEGGSWRQMRRWLGPKLMYRRQPQGKLGRRMYAALTKAFDSGCRRAVLIGTDIPGLTSVHLDEAFHGLDGHDLVLGPTLDGGYWLIGMKQPHRIFEDIPWGTATVLERTLEAAERQGLTVCLLESLPDVDRDDDLHLVQHLFTRGEPIVSVVVPTLNEEIDLGASLASAKTDGVEIIVADGGSCDATRALAQRLGARVLLTPCGRARQMNAGALAAKASILLFLHADTLLPQHWYDHVFEAMLDSSAVGGGFLWRTDLDGLCMRIARFFVRLRTVYLQEPWGDQAIFTRRTVLEAAGGFPDVPIAEDWDFVRALRVYGRVHAVRMPVLTSARRWRRLGMAKGFIINRLIILGCHLGLPRRVLADWYWGTEWAAQRTAD